MIGSLNVFVGSFDGGGFFAKGSAEKANDANKALKALVPVVDSLQIIGDKVSAMRSIAEGAIISLRIQTNMIANLNTFVESFDGGGFFTKGSEDKANDAQKSLKALIPVVDSLTVISNKINEMHGIKVNLETNVLEPLLRLDPGIQKVNDLSTAVHELNSAITQLVKENKKGLEQVADISTGGKGKIQFQVKLPWTKTAESNEVTAKKSADALAFIANEVKQIRSKVTETPVLSWKK
jgi:uncharacterized protein YoxC